MFCLLCWSEVTGRPCSSVRQCGLPFDCGAGLGPVVACVVMPTSSGVMKSNTSSHCVYPLAAAPGSVL